MADVAAQLADGFVAVVKRDCPTCTLVAPVLGALADRVDLTVLSQDDPAFPEQIEDVLDDTDLDASYQLGIETVPTILRVEDGSEVDRIVGWSREEWETFLGESELGPDLPDWRPGCGSLSVDPTRVDELRLRHEGGLMKARRVNLAELEDEMESLFDRGWTDGLPVVPPTPARVLRMLDGTDRAPDDVVALIPPDLAECNVEKVAINAVMAGCRPEYLPVVLAAVEAACTDEFNMHGLICTTWFAGPVVVVNGPIAGRIGMNSGGNALGQGNRANATVGRALQLVIRNVGGGRPGEIDKATMGNPGKYTFCFAENETDSPWESLAVEHGLDPGTSSVTLFAGSGVQGVIDQLSREPESLARSLAACLAVNPHPKLVFAFDAMLCISPEHARVFREAGWDKQRLRGELETLLTVEGDGIVAGAGDMAEGMPEGFAGMELPKFRPGGLQIVHVGGTAGLFSAIIGGWASGAMGSEPVTREIAT